MVITPHALAGALAASRTPSLAGGLLAATQSHLLLDRIPHEDYSIAGRAGMMRVALDAVIAVALLHISGGSTRRTLLGAVAGVAPDVLVVAIKRGWIPADVPGTGELVERHDANHTDHHVDKRLGWLIQIGLVAVLMVLLRRLVDADDES